MASLKHAGIVRTTLGAHGGYAMAVDPASVSLGRIIRLLDGALAPVGCVSLRYYEPCSCPNEATCALRDTMIDVRDAILESSTGRRSPTWRHVPGRADDRPARDPRRRARRAPALAATRRRPVLDPTPGTLLRLAAFTADPAGGNPAGVWIGDELPPAGEMQRIAAEVGYSETAFLAPDASGEPGRWRVRYFSPLAEVPFCGHATIASGVALAGRERG